LENLWVPEEAIQLHNFFNLCIREDKWSASPRLIYLWIKSPQCSWLGHGFTTDILKKRQVIYGCKEWKHEPCRAVRTLESWNGEGPLFYTWLEIHNAQLQSNSTLYFFSPVTQQPPLGQGILIIEASWSHSDTHHTR
jgi:hypothetical protein